MHHAHAHLHNILVLVELLGRLSSELLENFPRQRVPIGHQNLGGLEVELLRRVLGAVAAVDPGGGPHLDPVCAGAGPGPRQVQVSGVTPGERLPSWPRQLVLLHRDQPLRPRVVLEK